MADAVICLPNDKWTDIKEFCNRSCEVPPRFTYAALKKIYISKNFFPVGTVIDYECRPGYKKKPGLPTKVTCLDNVTWSTPETFCDKRSCPIPGEILNGYVEVKTDLLFGSQIFFSCETGYRLAGAASAFCLLSGNGVEWSEQLPLCTTVCLRPEIPNGKLSVEKDHYSEMENVTIQCDTGYEVVGPQSIICSENKTWYPEVPKCEWEVSTDCKHVIAGRKLMECLPSPADVKMALEIYKLSLEIEKLEKEKYMKETFYEQEIK